MRTMIRFAPPPRTGGMLAIGFLTIAAAPITAQTTRASAGEPAASAERPPEYARPIDVPSHLIRTRKPQAIVMPSVPADAPEEEASPARGGGVVADVKPTERVLPEGYVLARRPARFGKDEAWWAIAIGAAPGLPSGPMIRVLPNRRLMLLERVLADGKPDDTYLVTGRLTEFLGRNYVLLEEVTIPPAVSRAVATAPMNTADPIATNPASRPTRPPTASEIIEQLMTDSPVRTPQASTAPAPPNPGRAEAGGQARPEGTIVPEFPARLVRSENWWTLVRETRGLHSEGPPVSVLPNRLLEIMVSASAGGTKSIVFLVSGELTEYRGVNHLLLHKVLIRRDLGNRR